MMLAHWHLLSAPFTQRIWLMGSVCVCGVQVRRMWASEAKQMPILEFNLSKVLADFDLTFEQFVDVCVLAGCDYADNIKGQ
jgi:5'-3' exonuclease